MSEYLKALPRRVGDWSHEPAVRLTDPETGASKGMRVTRYDMIPPEALAEVAAVYGMGEKKYPSEDGHPNWLGKKDSRGGMPYSWHIRAGMEHEAKFRMGEDFDPEDGVHHLAHAIWHWIAILTYEARGMGKDDRNV